MSLFINGFVLLSHQSGIDISWSAAIRDVTGYIVEGAGLLAGWALIRHGLGPKRITTIRTFPLRHRLRLLSIIPQRLLWKEGEGELRLNKKREKQYTQHDLNQNEEESAIINHHMDQGKTIRPFPLRKLSSEGDPDGEEQKDEDGQISMEA